jgi:hypothetical protein
MPHLFINLLAPFLASAALPLGVTESQLLVSSGTRPQSLNWFVSCGVINAGEGAPALLLLLPRLLSGIEASRGLGFVLFFTFFLFGLINQVSVLPFYTITWNAYNPIPRPI